MGRVRLAFKVKIAAERTHLSPKTSIMIMIYIMFITSTVAFIFIMIFMTLTLMSVKDFS